MELLSIERTRDANGQHLPEFLPKNEEIEKMKLKKNEL